VYLNRSQYSAKEASDYRQRAFSTGLRKLLVIVAQNPGLDGRLENVFFWATLLIPSS